jgi:hypothetical protein
MKKQVKFFVALCILSAGMLAAQGLSAQKRVIKVQGHPHEYLTNLKGGKEDATIEPRLTGTSTDSIDFSKITCWAGVVDPTRPSARAALVVKWTDEKALQRDDSILVWGYHWNTVDASGFDVHKYTIDMIRAVGNTDCNFIALLQNTGGGNFTVGGIGYNFDDYQTPPNIIYNLAGAEAADSTVKFHYTNAPNCTEGQLGIPWRINSQVGDAINKATGVSLASKTGIIDHPFNADYGYPAYDYDYWSDDDDPMDGFEWQSGWYINGYWAFFTKNQPIGPYSYSNDGIAIRELSDEAVDGFVFAIGMDWNKTMSGSYNNGYDCNCGCSSNSSGTKTNKQK